MGNLSRSVKFKISFFLAGAYQTHVVVSEHGFKGKDIACVSKWLTEKGLTKLCSVFIGMYK